MSPVHIPSPGEAWAASLVALSKAYGVDESTMAQRVYAISEQIHQHYCLSRGIVNHNEARPDQDVAISILGYLAGADWWLVRSDERIWRTARGDVHVTAPVSIERLRAAGLTDAEIDSLGGSVMSDDTFVSVDGKTVYLNDDTTES